MKRIALLLAIFAIGLQSLWAQTREITGTVTSAEDGSTIPGVSVSVKGTTLGTITNLDGQYTLKVPQDANTLVFSFVGMQTQEATIQGTKVDAELESDVVGINEVVVTAIGIQRSKKALGYATSTVKNEELVSAREANVVNSLAGRVSGVRVTQQSGTLGGSSKIIIRGANSLGGNNQPLFVVDGVPISNSGYNGTRNQIIAGGVDAGNRASDINPDDVESMTVLKGAAASALYGARAKDGAIIITTKKGKKNQDLTVTINSSIRLDNVLKLPDFQNEYAQGNQGEYDKDRSNGWGPKISDVTGQTFTNFLGNDVTLQAYPDNVKNFYETGVSYINSVGFAGGSDLTDYRLGVTNYDQTGVTPDSKLKKYIIAYNGGTKINDKIEVRSSINFINSKTSGKPAQGSNDPNVLTNIINGLPRTISNSILRNNVTDADGLPYEVVKNTNNPYWVTQNNVWENELNRVYGNFSIDYNILDWLKLTARVGNDYFHEWRRHVTAMNTITAATGRFNVRNITRNQLNTDIMLTLNKKLSDDFDLTAVLGHNTNERFSRLDYITANDLIASNVYVPQNAKSVATNTETFKQRLIGAYFNATLGYKNMLYIDVTGRNDWSSTLPKQNNSYFYPSVSGSFIFTEVIPKNDILTYGKIRLNWANVGSDANPYSLDFTYSPKDTYFLQYLGYEGTLPHGSRAGYEAPNTIPPGDLLKPQNVVSYEVGTELKFFKSRIGLDFSYYKTNTTDQIISIAVAKSTGFWYKYVNAGEIQNEGIELALSGTAIKSTNFSWDINVNFSKNKNTVVELAEELKNYALTSGWSGLAIKAAPKESFGLYGAAWERDSEGNIVYDASNGRRKVIQDQRLGDIYPDWTMGISNSFSYKNFNLSCLVDIRQGGVIYSETVGSLRLSGLAKETLEHREGTFVPEGVNKNSDGTYTPNTKAVTIQDYWEDVAKTSNTEGNIFDASYVKLREVTLSYKLPKSILDNTFISSASIGVEGRNLWIIKDHVPHIDPEVNFFGSSLTGEGVEFQSVPSTRSIGFNVKLSF
ncbi:SusC/RagA family TonB-linked outer membrane protein [uncultured Sunxiuqinia sp.]|uniref:SusC/RagA family TonB-linked outer membrane protein n=1 Tax=uncultured Sunxiuqinia sp. TaxID=1573825 RepID=UPI002AA92B27|nr:SusC/RagA family TonB-linked outer membrane protein [uncultured Sunxiuqinia sp.]